MNLSAGAVAVREFPLSKGFADYLLYVNGKIIGVVEAKPEGHTLTGVEVQSAKYTEGLPKGLPAWRVPLPFAYESTGEVTQFTNSLEPDARSRDVFTFHRPEELLRVVRFTLKRYRASVLKSAVEGRLTEGWRRRNAAKEPASELLSRILKERRRRWEEGQVAAYAAKGKKPPKGWKEKYKEPAGVDTRALPGLPEGWCWASVEELARVGTGTTPRRGISKFWDGGTVPWVTSTAVNEPNVTRGNELVTEDALKETNLTPYPPGTLIIALYGEGKTRGKVSELLIEATINQALAALQMEGSAGEVREYLKLFLLGNYEKLRRGSAGGVQPNLNLGLVKRIAVPLPPLVEQQMIAAEVEEKMSVVDQVSSLVKGSHARGGRLQQAILKRAFEGKLIEQEPVESHAGDAISGKSV